MHKYIIYTLIDITSNNLSNQSRKQKNQNRNRDTFSQLINLRCIPQNKLSNKTTKTGYELNTILKRTGLEKNKSYSVWYIEFENEHLIDEYAINNDFDNVPIIVGLEESEEIVTKCVKTSSIYANSVCVLLKSS